MSLDYNDLALFVRVADSGSFTAAAAALKIQKSSVARGIARLERELGVRLFQRSTHSRGLTVAGTTLYERVHDSVVSLRTAADVVQELDHEEAGVVRVTSAPILWEFGFVGSVASFVRAHPKIHIEFVLTERNVDLIADGIDLAVRTGPLPDSTLVSRRIGHATLGLFASPSYVAERGLPATIDELSAHDAVLVRNAKADDASAWRLREAGGEARTVRVTGPVSADEAGFVFAMVAGGIGIGTLPTALATGKGLVRVLPEVTAGEVDVHLVMPSAKLVPTRVAVVRDWLVRELSRRLDHAGPHSAYHDGPHSAHHDGPHSPHHDGPHSPHHVGPHSP